MTPAASPSSGPELEVAAGAALVARATALMKTGEFGRAYELLRGVPAERLRAEPELGIMLGRCLEQRYELAPAVRVLDDVRPYVLATGSRFLLQRWEHVSGPVRMAMGHFQAARAHGEAALAAADPATDAEPLSRTCNFLGNLFSFGKDYPRAVVHYQRAMLYAQRARDRRMVGMIHHNLGLDYRFLGRFGEADRSFRTVVEAYAEEFSAHERGHMMMEHAILQAARGDVRLARATLRRSAALVEAARLPADIPRAQGIVAVAGGELDEAQAHLDLALELATARGHRTDEAETREELAHLAALRGDAAASEAHLRAAVEIWDATGFATAVERALAMRARGVSPTLLR